MMPIIKESSKAEDFIKSPNYFMGILLNNKLMYDKTRIEESFKISKILGIHAQGNNSARELIMHELLHVLDKKRGFSDSEYAKRKYAELLAYVEKMTDEDYEAAYQIYYNVYSSQYVLPTDWIQCTTFMPPDYVESIKQILKCIHSRNIVPGYAIRAPEEMVAECTVEYLTTPEIARDISVEIGTKLLHS